MVRRSIRRNPGLSKKIITISSKPREHATTRYATFKREIDDDGVRTTHYLTVPRLQEDHTPVELFNIFHEFDELRNAHQIDDGALLFCYFRSIISSCRKATKLWSAEPDSLRTRNETNFDLAYDAFKANILSKLNYHDQLEYLRTLRKPGPMSVDELIRELYPYQPRKNENKPDTDTDETSNASVNEQAANDTPEESNAADDDDPQDAEHYTFEATVH